MRNIILLRSSVLLLVLSFSILHCSKHSETHLECHESSQCTQGERCNGGACVPDVLPDEFTCFTPCKADLRDPYSGKIIVACPADGLMPGCFDDNVCDHGRCTRTAILPQHATSRALSAPKNSCEYDHQCADFEACVQGLCISTCNVDDECTDDQSCYRHVCRSACDPAKPVCPKSHVCATQDRDAGYCMPIAPATSYSTLNDGSTYTLSESRITLSDYTSTAQVEITNNSAGTETFVVRKKEHTEYSESGTLTVSEDALTWLSLGASGAEVNQPEYQFTVSPNSTATFSLIVDLSGPSRWRGELEVLNQRMGQQSILLNFASIPEGRWTGRMVYFSNFPDQNLPQWLQNRASQQASDRVGNALFQKWRTLREQRGLDGIPEWLAILQATESESWRKSDTVLSYCPKTSRACYLYPNTFGYGIYSDDLTRFPIPTGAAELPFAMNIRSVSSAAESYVGKIDSAATLQYAGDPALTLQFSNDPHQCSQDGQQCIVGLESFNSVITLGGTFIPEQDSLSCGNAAYQMSQYPSLVAGFFADTVTANNRPYQRHCRDTAAPFGAHATRNIYNSDFSSTNPYNDGLPYTRTISLVDGGLINQELLFVIFKESVVSSSLGEASQPTYGYLVLHREPLPSSDPLPYEGNSQISTTLPSKPVVPLKCSDTFLSSYFAYDQTLSSIAKSGRMQELTQMLLNGTRTFTSANAADAYLPKSVGRASAHYYCGANKLFDRGPHGAANPIACPEGSVVHYFIAPAGSATHNFETLACNIAGDCSKEFDIYQKSASILVDPARTCNDTNKVFCDARRTDLLAESTLWVPQQGQQVHESLQSELAAAFYYKTNFRSASGAGVGFAPTICEESSALAPFCYNPSRIEEVIRRVDCAIEIAVHYAPSAAVRWSDGLYSQTYAQLLAYLRNNFGYQELYDTYGQPAGGEAGFEYLLADLMITLGDEAYTQGLVARFDLAGSKIANFEGSQFETGGPSLTGGAGNEMLKFYTAAQYYQYAIERFNRLRPILQKTLDDSSIADLPTQQTATFYYNRLIHAATQKARVWQEIGTRYHRLNLGSLAKQVMERAYTSTYLESVMMKNAANAIIKTQSSVAKAQLVHQLEQSQLSFRMTLLQMQSSHAQVSTHTDYFGLPSGIIPFPIGANGLAEGAQRSIDDATVLVKDAQLKEDLALAQTRSFFSSAADFNRALFNLKTTHETTLSRICGSFKGSNNTVYPAIPAYAQFDDKLKLLAKPCGMAGNGELYDAMGAVDIAATNLSIAIHETDSVIEMIDAENTRLSETCNVYLTLADLGYASAMRVSTMQRAVDDAKHDIDTLEDKLQLATNIAQLTKCAIGLSSDCASAAGALSILTATSGAIFLTKESIYKQSEELLSNIDAERAETIRAEKISQCELAEINNKPTILSLQNELITRRYAALNAARNLQLAYGRVIELMNAADQEILHTQEEKQMVVNSTAASVDENMRIYKNDAVVSADDTFERALQAAYKATVVYEYATSQSYAAKGQLFLTRMISSGDYPLEQYMARLQQSLNTFREQTGPSQARVIMISLRDDILAVPRIDTLGQPLSERARVEYLRRALSDGSLVAADGTLTVRFATALDRLSPRTWNHKIASIEAEIIGADVGDAYGRVYLSQTGTSTVAGNKGEQTFYLLPKRSDVINTYFNGFRSFGDPALYQSTTLAQRPVVNTQWQLVLDGRNESENRDINIGSLTDIRLYVHYLDYAKQD